MTHYCKLRSLTLHWPIFIHFAPALTQGKTAPWNPFVCRIWIPSTPNGTPRLVQTAVRLELEGELAQRFVQPSAAGSTLKFKMIPKVSKTFFLPHFRCFQDFIIMIAIAHSHLIYFPVKISDQWRGLFDQIIANPTPDWKGFHTLQKGFIWFEQVLWNAVLLWESWKAPGQNSWRSTISD